MSLIAHWPLEGNPNDEAYGNYNGTEVGGVSYGDGILGDCYDNTSGSGTGIQLMEHADAQKFDNVFSWSLWFKSTTTNGSNNERILARDDSEYPTFTIDQNQSGQQNLDSDAAGSAQVNEWHHAAFVHQSDQTVITYIDGVRQGTRSAPKANTARPWVIGGNTEGDGDISGNHFEGKIDDCRFYDHVLSKAEVKELSQGKVGHWEFFDGNAYDSTIQRNHGTLQGNPQRADGIIGSDSMYFDGNGDYVQIDDLQDFSNINRLTVSAWARSPQSTWDATGFIVSRRNHFIIHPDNNSRNVDFYVHTDPQGWENVSYAPSDITVWHHYALTYDKGSLKGYVDGQQIGSTSAGSPLETDNGLTLIGADDDPTPGEAYIDDVRIYSTALSQNEIQTIYETKARLDEGHRFHGHAVEEGAYESFETGGFSENWNVSNATISSSRQYRGTYSFGSWGDGGIEATWEVFPNDERKIKSFEYFWKEDSSQSGHVVALNDSNGNVIQESGTENPQWYLNNGSGGREFISSSGTNYNVWTKFRFEFDWENGNYDYLLEKTNGSHKETGTQPLESASNGVQYIRFTQGSSLNYYGSGNYNRFDGIKVNEEGVREEGFIDSSKFSEVGPAADSLVGWWDFDRENGRDKAGNKDGDTSGRTYGQGVDGGKAAIFLGNSTIPIGTDNEFQNQRLTACAWSNANSWSSRDEMFNWDGGGFHLATVSNGVPRFWLNLNGSWAYIDGPNSIPTGEWHFFVGTWDGNEQAIWLDGEKLNSRTDRSGTIPYPTNNDQLSIGGYDGNSNVFDGRIDDVRLYERSLTDEEIQVLYEMSGPDAKMKKRPEGFYAPQFSETQL